MTKDEQSLLNEIEELQVLEAKELQEGVAFHAFRFKMPAAMEALILNVRGRAEALADDLKLPRGATLTDVVDDKMRVMFDPDAVKPEEIKKAVAKALGEKLDKVEHDEKTRFEFAKARR